MSTEIIIAIVIAIAVICILLLNTKYKKYASEILLFLVTEAEREFGSGTGKLKYSAVTLWLHEQLPPLAKTIFSAKTIDRLIEDAVEYMQEYLESNVNAKKIVDGEVDGVNLVNTGEYIK